MSRKSSVPKTPQNVPKALTSDTLQLATPHIINLDVDPKERKPFDYPYIHSWVIAHAAKIVADFKASTKMEELIPVGAPLDFVPAKGSE